MYNLNNNLNSINYTYNKDDAITKVSFGDNNLNYTYDYLGRLIAKDINGNQRVEYAYKSNGNKTSATLKSMKINNDLYEYIYDNLYNTTDIYLNKELINHYEYDNFNELIEEDDYRLNKTIKYTYDIEGNILSKKEYELNTENIINANTYEYNNTLWEDQLTKFNNETITYDNIGNPLTIGNKTLSWENVNSLKTYKDLTNNINVTYEYDNENLRLSKSVNNITKQYFWESNNIMYEKFGDNLIYYLRDNNNALIGLKYNDTMYYYIKNMQEDIIGIADSNNNILCSYEYDSWGNIITIKDNNGNIITDESHIGIINPYRYRSYYYDNETKLYYLNSRYYNPEWGRFINADIYVDTKQDVNSTNMYSYTGNNPINRIDLDGELWFQIAGMAAGAVISGGIKAISNVMNGEKIYSGVVSAAIGGAYAGLVMTSPIGFTPAGLIASTYGSAFIESEISGNSIKDTVANTVVNGTIGVVSGKVGDKVAKLNKGWIRPTKLKTSFTGNYIKQVAKNMSVQSVSTNVIKKANDVCKKGADYVKSGFNKAKKTIKSVFKKIFSK